MLSHARAHYACMTALALFLDDRSLARENDLPSRYHFVSWWSLSQTFFMSFGFAVGADEYQTQKKKDTAVRTASCLGELLSVLLHLSTCGATKDADDEKPTYKSFAEETPPGRVTIKSGRSWSTSSSSDVKTTFGAYQL